MALTIRTLSVEAEKTLSKIIKDIEHINTNSKAIEFVLENYLLKCDALKEEEQKCIKLQRKLVKAQDKLQTIANGFSVISEMIAK